MNQGMGTTDQPVQLSTDDGLIFLDNVGEEAQLSYSRDGSDLLLESSDGQSFVVPNYYTEASPTDIMLPNGDIKSGEELWSLPNSGADMQLAQSAAPGIEGVELAALGGGVVSSELGDPIGTVETLTGSVTITRADGSVVNVQVGDKLYQGDVVETSEGGGIGAVFADTSSLAIGESSEIVLDELIYDPGTQEGSSVISLLEGTMNYVSGQIAKINPDAVAITTPVTTIGIRGTKVFVEYKDGDFQVVNLLEPTLEGEAAGEIVLYNQAGEPVGTINEAGLGWEMSAGDNADGALPRMINLDPSRVEFLTRELEELLPESLIEKARDAMELQEALEEAAALVAEEAKLAEAAAEGAKEEAEEKQAALEAAEEELKALEEELSELEEQLKENQLELEELLALRLDPPPPSLLEKQTLVERLQAEYQQAMEDVQNTRSDVATYETQLAQAWRTYEHYKQDADASSENLSQVQIALNAITQESRSYTEAAINNSGYEANNDSGFGEDEDDENFSIDELNNLASASGGSGNQDHLLAPAQGGEESGDGGVFVPHETTGSEEGDGDAFSFSVSDGGDEADGTGGSEETGNSEEERDDPVPTVEFTPDPQPILLNGTVIDGYLENARVFIDVNQDGDWDVGEDFTFTDGTGNFELETLQSGPLMIQGEEGTIDIATGLPFYGSMTAPEGSTVITPVTSLVSALMEADSSLTAETAQDLVEAAFNISHDGLLGEHDPIANAADQASAKIAALGVQIQNLIVQGGNLLEGAFGEALTSAAASDAIYDAIAAQILADAGNEGDGGQDETFSIDNVSSLEAVINSAAQNVVDADASSSDPKFTAEQASAAQTSVENNAADAGQVIGDTNSLITTYVNDGVSGTDMLSSIARVAVVANNSAETFNNVGAGTAELDPESFAAALEEEVANAQIGNVTGTNSAPVAQDGVDTAIEGGAIVSGQVTATDAEGNELTFSLVAPVDGLTFNEDGTYSFDPSHEAYEYLAVDEETVISFDYVVSDSEGLSDRGQVEITVTGTNTAPVAVADTVDAQAVSGLVAEFYSYDKALGHVKYGESVADVLIDYIADTDPNASFLAETLSFSRNSRGLVLNTVDELDAFVGDNASALVDHERAEQSAGLIHMKGYINLEAGAHTLNIESPDGYRILIDGGVAAERDNKLGLKGDEYFVFANESGPVEIEIIYWDAAGRYNFEASLDGEVIAGNTIFHGNVVDDEILFSAQDLLSNDTDVENDDVSIGNFHFDAAEIESISHENGQITLTAADGFNSETTFSYTVTDGAAESEQGTVSFNYGALVLDGGDDDTPDVDPGVESNVGLRGAFYTYGADVLEDDRTSVVDRIRENILGGETGPRAEFVATNLDFGYAGTKTLDTINELNGFLGESGEITAVDNTVPDGDAGLLVMTGVMKLSEGTQSLSVFSDDGFQFTFKGAGEGGSDIVIERDTHQALYEHVEEFSVTEAGFYEVEILYWDQGGYYQFDATLNGQFIEGDMLYQTMPESEDEILVENEPEAPVVDDPSEDETDLVYNGTEETMYGTDGEDTLSVDGDVDLDLTDGSVVLNSIENINLFNDSGSNILTIDEQAALDMAGDDGHVVIDGSGSDEVVLEGNWTERSGSSEGYSIYDGDNGAEVHIAQGIHSSVVSDS